MALTASASSLTVGERQGAAHELLASRLVAVAVQPQQQPTVLLRASELRLRSSGSVPLRGGFRGRL